MAEMSYYQLAASRKRKEIEALSSAQAAEPISSNRLLAGYMAYEFLTKGTLLGEKFDPTGAEPLHITKSSSVEPKRMKPPGRTIEVEPRSRSERAQKRYAEVASLLKTDGAHVTGVVNPTQLVRWIQM